MIINNAEETPLQLQGGKPSKNKRGSIINKKGGADAYVNKARNAFNTLRPIWRSKTLSLYN